MIERQPDPKNTVVVSDDKEIAVFVKSCGVRSMSVEEFIGPGKPPIKEDLKPELNYSQIAEINEELRRIWLK